LNHPPFRLDRSHGGGGRGVIGTNVYKNCDDEVYIYFYRSPGKKYTFH
jgi:hypothetical protein